MSGRDPLVWRKASASGSSNNCVQVAFQDGMIYVRDSKDPGTVLCFTTGEWLAHLDGVRKGEFDPPVPLMS